MRAGSKRRLDRLTTKMGTLESKAKGPGKLFIMVEVERHGPDLYRLHDVEYTGAELERKLAEEHAAFKRDNPNGMFIEVSCPYWSPDQEDE